MNLGIFTSVMPACYVIEVRAGFFTDHDPKIDDILEIVLQIKGLTKRGFTHPCFCFSVENPPVSI